MHTAAEWLRARLGASWDRNDLRQCLSASTLGSCGRHLERGDWLAAQSALSTAILARPSRFVLDPSTTSLLRREIRDRWPRAPQEASARADRILDGRYDLLGYRDVKWTRDGRVDWQFDPVHQRRPPRRFYADVPFLDAAIGDHKIIWELNRHQHWLQLGRAAWLTGDGKYAAAIGEQLEDWLADNPPYMGINWASMLEIGFRAISWTWALHSLLAIPNAQRPTPTEKRPVGNWELRVESYPWLIDMLVALDRQLTHVERHLSYYFSPNTHLTGEALALYVVGTALPELSASARWAETGRRVLLDEIDRQILDDGGHAERSMHYQRYTLDFYLLAARTARLAGDASAARRFDAAALRLASEEAGIPVEVVPGVTSAISVPAAAGIPVTHRGVARGFSVLTGHESVGDFPTDRSHTLVLLMGVSRLRATAEEFVAAGHDPETPVAVVESGWSEQQRVTVGTLATIADAADKTGARPPAVTVVGDVVMLSPHWRQAR